jgi:flagellar biogenesis protein FliO
MEWVIVKTLLSLVVVLALMFGLVLLLKKVFYGFGATSSTLVDIELLGTRSLQPKRVVYVLKVLNKVFVVGSSEQGLHTLTEIDDGESMGALEEKILAARARGKNALATQPFALYLQKYVPTFKLRGIRKGSVL